MLRADDLDTSLNGHRHFLLHVIAGACPLGLVVVGQLTHPVRKPDLYVTIEGGDWEVLDGAGEEGDKEERGGWCVRINGRHTKVTQFTLEEWRIG